MTPTLEHKMLSGNPEMYEEECGIGASTHCEALRWKRLMLSAGFTLPSTAMDKNWISAYPSGTPAKIDADAYASLVAILEESCRRFANRPACSNLGGDDFISAA